MIPVPVAVELSPNIHELTIVPHAILLRLVNLKEFSFRQSALSVILKLASGEGFMITFFIAESEQPLVEVIVSFGL